MSTLGLLSAFATAFIQHQRLLTLQLGDGGRWGETLQGPLAQRIQRGII
ncbi:MAG TPA: hypothetical protein VJ575_01910 [Pseudogulbenkiania sp.]|nr:hypothetical protein [Pseudogulbenkiania sp.]